MQSQRPSHDDKRDRARAQEQLAAEAISAIFSGADLVEESTRLANEYTDRQTSRLSSWFRRGR